MLSDLLHISNIYPDIIFFRVILLLSYKHITFSFPYSYRVINFHGLPSIMNFLIFVLTLSAAVLVFTIPVRPPPARRCPSSCASCDRGGWCTACKSDTAVLARGRCVCRVRNQVMNSEGVCMNCHYSCAKCRAPWDPAACTACHPSARLVGGRCTCPHGKGMTADGTCKPCHPSCETCVMGGDNRYCTSCTDDLAVLTHVPIICILIFPPPPGCEKFPVKFGKCICTSGYFTSEPNGVCQACDPACLGSTSPACPCECRWENCQSCDTTSTRCEVCKLGYYMSAEGACLPCDSTCSQCINGNEDGCTECAEGYRLEDPNVKPGRCVIDTQASYYRENEEDYP